MTKRQTTLDPLKRLRRHDLTGQIFGQLQALEFFDKRPGVRWKWLCLACGNMPIIFAAQVKKGGTKTCGCGRIKHGQSPMHTQRTPEYSAWESMNQRCENPTNPNYKNYGARGISVDSEWRKDFRVFFAAVGKRPSPQHSLERINNNGNYEPGNVEWATRAKQSRNKRTNRLIEWQDEILCMTDWAERLHMTPSNLDSRIERWGIEKAMTTPLQVTLLRNAKGQYQRVHNDVA